MRMLGAEPKNPNCAYAWMDWASSPKVNGAIAMNFGMASTNAAFCETSDKVQARCDCFTTTNEEYFRHVWSGRPRRTVHGEGGVPANAEPLSRGHRPAGPANLCSTGVTRGRRFRLPAQPPAR